MAHTTAAKLTASQKSNRTGKRRGVKKYEGELVKAGNIIVRQLGTKFHPGDNVSMGKDYTIYSLIEGKVYFKNGTGKRSNTKFICVKPLEVTEVKNLKSKVSPKK